MKAISFSTDGVVIGSNTLHEYKMQVMNFMNMLYSNIHYSDGKDEFSTGNCMTVGVVHTNLTSEIKRAIAEVSKTKTIWMNLENNVYALADAIYANLSRCKVEDAHTREVKAHCDILWRDLLKTLKDLLKLEFTLNV